MVSNEDVLKALVDVGSALHRDFEELKLSLGAAARSINEQKIEEAKLLARELEELSAHILNTKREIAMLAGGEAPGPRIMTANFELDAIVKATEEATNGIMTAAEMIEGLATRIADNPDFTEDQRSALVGEINAEVIRIFEHCNFQDITGQRIHKVVRTLDYIETRIENMIEIWARTSFADVAAPPESKPEGDAALLNGPQLPSQGVSQNEIDELFN